MKAPTRRGFLASLAAMPFAGILGLRPKKRPIVFRPDKHFAPGLGKKIFDSVPEIRFRARLYDRPEGLWIIAWDGPKSGGVEIVGSRLTAEYK